MHLDQVFEFAKMLDHKRTEYMKLIEDEKKALSAKSTTASMNSSTMKEPSSTLKEL